jgi:TRAP transporter TAXI family solute receptor
MIKKVHKCKIIIVALSFVCFMGLLPAASVAMDPVSLKLASFKVGSGWYVLGGVMADVIKSGLPAGSTVDAMPKAGGVGNPQLIGAKKADFALAFPVTAKWAYNGVQNYKEKLQNIRVVAGGLDSYWVLGAVKADSNIKTWGDVKNKKIGIRLSTQSKGSLSEVAAGQVLKTYGVSYDNLTEWGGKILMQGFNEMVPALKEGAIDGFLMMATPYHPTWTEAAIARDLRFISMEDDIIKKMGDEYGYAPSAVPAGMFKGQDKATKVIGFPTVLITRDDMADDIVYAALKAIVVNTEKIKAAYKAFEAFDAKTAWTADKRGGVPLHPGAVKFYKEKGWM